MMRNAGRPGDAWMVGLMSGTSVDGIDAVVARISGGSQGLRAEVAAHVHRPFRQRLRRRVLHASTEGRVAEICDLNFKLGEEFARAALAAIRAAGLSPERIRGIGSHGQTIHHLPRGKNRSTLQIGEPAVIAERTGITTVGDFRVRDLAAGGQGAPLVAYVDWVLFTHADKPRVIQNIGGIANLTFLPRAAAMSQVIAFDTGPGNMVLDAMAFALSQGRRAFDRNGQWASRGHLSSLWLRKLMEHPFLRRLPPKTTGREEFGSSYTSRALTQAMKLGLSKEDIMATVTAFTAASMVDAYHRFIFPKIPAADLPNLEIFLAGGGAENLELKRMLDERLAGPKLLTHKELGIGNTAKEALAFAILAYETLNARPNNVPGATGARHRVILGKIVPGRVSPGRPGRWA